MQRIRQLLDLLPRAERAGLIGMGSGAFAVRGSEGFYITPERTGEQWNWQLAEQDLVLFPGGGEASMSRAGRRPCRESRLMRAILAAFPHWNAVYHGHSWGLLGFAIAGQPLPVPAHHAYRAVGAERALVVACAQYGREQEEAVIEALKKAFDRAACGAVLVNGWGAFIAGPELESTLAFAEGLEELARAQQWRLRASG